jgi:pimeloyl-ACP methyl ester carboxylesterase
MTNSGRARGLPARPRDAAGGVPSGGRGKAISAARVDDTGAMSHLRAIVALVALVSAVAAGAGGETAPPRWSGRPEYRRLAGEPTSAGPERDVSWVLVYPASRVLRGTLILVPGLGLGALSFDALARRLVTAAPGWQVWAWDRRANGLEDRRGFATTDPWAYYRGFSAAAPPYLREWGLATHLGDLDRVVEAARPFGPVVLAGHSIGAGIVGAYGLEHDEKIAGLVLLDGSPDASDRVTRAQYLNGRRTLFRRIAGLDDLESGRVPAYLEVFGIGPRQLAEGEALAALAAADPQADAPSDAAPWPASAEAAALARISERYTPLPLFAVSAGRATGREGIDPIGLLMGRISYRIKGAREGRVEWQEGDGATSADELLRSFALPETGFFEWLMPYRLVLDLTAWDIAVPALRPRRHHFPILCIGAGRGLVRRAAGFDSLHALTPGTEIDATVVPDVTHLDLLTGKDGPAVGLLAAYLIRAERAERLAVLVRP